MWRKWRSLRPSRGCQEWDVVQFKEVWLLEVPVPLMLAEVSPRASENLTGGRYLTERLWEKLDRVTAVIQDDSDQTRSAHAMLESRVGGARERYGRVLIVPYDLVLARWEWHGAILVVPRHLRSWLARGCVDGQGDDSAVALRVVGSAMPPAGAGVTPPPLD